MSANLYDLLSRRFPADRSKPCFLLSDGRAISYGELEAGAGQVAGRLIAEGVEPGDRVALQAEKTAEAIMVYLGVLKAGAVFLPLNSAYTAAEVDYFLGDAEPKVLVTDPPAWVAEAAGYAPLETTVARAADDLASLIYTSGTTGRSKGAMLSHGNLAENALALHAAWGFTPDDVLLHALPIFHVHGLFVALHCALLSGCPMVWLPKFADAEVLAGLDRATVMMGVPTFYTRLLDNPGFTRAKAENVRLFVCGSAPLLPSTFAEFEDRTGQRILERYGMSEAVIITTNPLDGDRIAGSVGYPLPGVDLRIGGGEETGVIQIKGPSVFREYWRMPEKTAEEFTADGFFITGDVGRRDPDGRVWISGRAKDLIISGGYNVYPKEVELVLDELPGVTESAVIGVPHKDFGEGVVAVVIGRGDEAAMIAKAREQLAAYKAPKRIVFVDELPRNAMGKVQKNLLRQAYERLFET
ncbi:MAG: malonyl-CoA synthase [Alphaproteobacteria bacterium]|nr:malonyl-CoA synthase [Alphaproteobacteria bacterium]MBU1514757.1 malonyl-CoA synthase [Alphaproteobacteria bacterium]MBU2093888.1 malonyl-CoA synthase [Alphaproteobacteria bacterium]MBU2153315.1 malonyl-CoA synthase [Alphaproteobacteria bacterium]MBU2309743.1 malonyl-CoA synthase [Alphaproteobacteria bacterium]